MENTESKIDWNSLENGFYWATTKRYPDIETFLIWLQGEVPFKKVYAVDLFNDKIISAADPESFISVTQLPDPKGWSPK